MINSLPIIIDCGSYLTKYSLNSQHLDFHKSLIYRVRQEYRPLLYQFADKVKCPIKNGILRQGDNLHKSSDITNLWHQTIGDPQGHQILLSESSFTPRKTRQKITEIFFQQLQVSQFYLAQQAALSIYSSYATTGIVVDIGEDTTTVTPVFDGYVICPQAIQTEQFGGRHLTELMVSQLRTFEHSQKLSVVREKGRTIKQELGYVSLDFQKDNFQKSNQVTYYTLPDGKVTPITNQPLLCGQALFGPSLANYTFPGIHAMIKSCIENCDEDIRRRLAGNIVLAGGSSNFPGIIKRLSLEMTKLIPYAFVNRLIPSDRRYSACIGGQILTSLQSFKPMWITRQQYQETGSSIVHKKCW